MNKNILFLIVLSIALFIAGIVNFNNINSYLLKSFEHRHSSRYILKINYFIQNTINAIFVAKNSNDFTNAVINYDLTIGYFQSTKLFDNQTEQNLLLKLQQGHELLDNLHEQPNQMKIDELITLLQNLTNELLELESQNWSKLSDFDSMVTTKIDYSKYSFLTIMILLFIFTIITYYIIFKKRALEDELLNERELFKQGSVVLFKWRNDEHWSIEFVTQNVFNLTGYTHEEFYQNVQYAQLIHADDLQTVQQEVGDEVSKKSSHFNHQPYRIITKNGETKWVLDQTKIVYDKDKNVTHFLGYVIDITELQNYRIELEERVIKEVNLRREKEKLLIHQSKIADMTNMIQSI
ncbi:MAG: PAS domain-containing protein, partial [Campylobacterales bacterium]|nr:PAS domain-containing protein [Campylobacterales bacterium]